MLSGFSQQVFPIKDLGFYCWFFPLGEVGLLPLNIAVCLAPAHFCFHYCHSYHHLVSSLPVVLSMMTVDHSCVIACVMQVREEHAMGHDSGVPINSISTLKVYIYKRY